MSDDTLLNNAARSVVTLRYGMAQRESVAMQSGPFGVTEM